MKMRVGFLIFTLFLSIPWVCAAEELGGGYSVAVPEQWIVGDFPGSKYKGLFGARVENFTPNINIQEENFGGPMDTYIDLSMVQLEKMMRAQKVSQGSFSAGNIQGVKVVTHTEFNDFKLQQTLYLFESPPGQKVVVTATTSRDLGSQMDPVFDNIMKTFKVK